MRVYNRVTSLLLGVAMLAMSSFAFAATQSSQFLDIHPELKPDPDRPGEMEWRKPGFDLANYDKVMFAPLTIFVDPNSEYKGLDSEDVRALAEGFRNAVVKTLEPEVQVVDVPGPGVLYVRAALINVKLRKQKRGLLGYTPLGFIITSAMDLAGKRISLENAALEMEVYNAATLQPVGVIIDSHPSVEKNSQEEYSWKSIETTMTYYAKRFKSRLLAAHEHHG